MAKHAFAADTTPTDGTKKVTEPKWYKHFSKGKVLVTLLLVVLFLGYVWYKRDHVDHVFFGPDSGGRFAETASNFKRPVPMGSLTGQPIVLLKVGGEGDLHLNSIYAVPPDGIEIPDGYRLDANLDTPNAFLKTVTSKKSYDAVPMGWDTDTSRKEYTNAGSNVKFKLDGNPPAAQVLNASGSRIKVAQQAHLHYWIHLASDGPLH